MKNMRIKIYLILLLTLFSVSLNADNLTNYLMPIPKKLEEPKGILNRLSGRIIIPGVFANASLLSTARTIQSLLTRVKIETSIAARAAKDEIPLACIYLTPSLPSQAYRIKIQPNQILIEGGDEAGLFYALQTFKQIVAYAKEQGALPLVSIEDSPDFKRRGVLLDVSRNKVPTMNTLKNLVDLFASWKLNEIQLYTENTFAYQNHRVVWEGFSPMTAGEIIELDQYCRERFIDLVPNQTSFGHMNQWIEHEQYNNLAEVPGPNPGHVMNPTIPETKNLMSELFAELLPNFSSRYFNINCDETEAIGTGQSKEIVKQKGAGRVYLDYLLQLKSEVDKYGRTTQFWGDIILKHPELIPELPKDMIALIWGYGTEHPFEENCEKIREAGCAFYVCPGTSSWVSLVGRNQNAFGNLKNAAMNGLKYGAMGFLNTDWGDAGHWQPLSVSYPTYLFGAAVSWGFESNQQINVGKLVSRYIFDDTSGKSGQALIDIGNAYLLTPDVRIFHWLLAAPDRPQLKQSTTKDLKSIIDYLDQNLQILLNSPMACEDSKIVKAEMDLAVNMSKLACRIGLTKFTDSDSIQDLKDVPEYKRKALAAEYKKMIEEYKKIWILRNRPGGLHVSAGNLERGMSKLLK